VHSRQLHHTNSNNVFPTSQCQACCRALSREDLLHSSQEHSDTGVNSHLTIRKLEDQRQQVMHQSYTASKNVEVPPSLGVTTKSKTFTPPSHAPALALHIWEPASKRQCSCLRRAGHLGVESDLEGACFSPVQLGTRVPGLRGAQGGGALLSLQVSRLAAVIAVLQTRRPSSPRSWMCPS